MKLTETLNQDIAEFEQATGRLVSNGVLPLLKAMAAAGDYFEELGTKDAATGRPQRKKKVFIEWWKRELIDPVDKDHSIVELMYTCYLNGYNQ